MATTREDKSAARSDALAAWSPGLDNDGSTMRAVYDRMPRGSAPKIPWYVSLLENPASPLSLAGAVDIFTHDCIHIVLGRGTLSQDEAFVIGFTMGASGKLSSLQHRLFALCARFMYRGTYRFSDIDQRVFDRAVSLALQMRPVPLHSVAYERLMDRPLGEVRAILALDMPSLLEAYAHERASWPDSTAARHLPRADAPTRRHFVGEQ